MDDKELKLQRKCQNLVHKHVYVCQSSLVDEMLRQEIFSHEDIENTNNYKDELDLAYEYEDEWKVYCAAESEVPDTFLDYLMSKEEKVFLKAAASDVELNEESLKEEYRDHWFDWEAIETARTNIWYSGHKGDSVNTFAEYLEHVEHVDEWDLREEAEIFEWWVISDWLEYQLKERGEAFLENDYGTWWGRQCSGQAIALDSVIVDIVKDYEAKYGESFDS